MRVGAVGGIDFIAQIYFYLDVVLCRIGKECFFQWLFGALSESFNSRGRHIDEGDISKSLNCLKNCKMQL
jgi:hypothetical protein